MLSLLNERKKKRKRERFRGGKREGESREELNSFPARGDVKPGAEPSYLQESRRRNRQAMDKRRSRMGPWGKKERKETGRRRLAKQAYFIDIVFMILTRVCSTTLAPLPDRWARRAGASMDRPRTDRHAVQQQCSRCTCFSVVLVVVVVAGDLASGQSLSTEPWKGSLGALVDGGVVGRRVAGCLEVGRGQTGGERQKRRTKRSPGKRR